MHHGFYMESHFTPFALLDFLLLSYHRLSVRRGVLSTLAIEQGYKDITLVYVYRYVY